MPELPEVETVVRTLEQLIKGKEIKDIQVYWDNTLDQKNLDQFKSKLIGQVFRDFSRRGKYLLFWSDDYLLVVHLRMEGKFFYYQNTSSKEKHTHVVFVFTDNSELHYNDVRKFGKMYIYDSLEEFETKNHLGKEPFDDSLTVDYIMSSIKNKKMSLKQFLLDQRFIAGIGNIYADEICFQAKISPMTPINLISKKSWSTILEVTKNVLKQAINQGGTTIRSYTSSLGVTGLFQQELNVYGRAGKQCRSCGSILAKTKVTGRTTVYCPKCQKVKI